MTQGFLDLHHHLVYGLDADGPKTREEMHRMIDLAARDGITDLVATPHVTPGLRPFDLGAFLARLQEARDYCREQGHAIRLYPGAEVLYTDYACDHLQMGRVPTLAGSQHVLVEFSPDIPFDRLEHSLRQLVQAGFLPILAHTERYPCLTRHPKRATALKQQLPLSYQVNASFFLRKQGFLLRRFVRHLLKTGLLDFVSSDAHNTGSRRVNLREGFASLKASYPQFQQGSLF